MATFGDNDRKLLIAHHAFYHALDTGGRVPTTSAQRHFVAVCRGTASPETEHELAYVRFRHAVKTAGIDEANVVAAGFVLPSGEIAGDDDAASEVSAIPVRPCVGCGRPIPPERLEALSDAVRCVLCQHRTESGGSNWRVSEVECPRCAKQGFKSPMVWRVARDPAKFSGYFLGCSRFPECRYIDRS
jgi:hypothetical protein